MDRRVLINKPETLYFSCFLTPLGYVYIAKSTHGVCQISFPYSKENDIVHLIQNNKLSRSIHGNIRIKEGLELTNTAKIFGDIKTKTLSVAPGAIINGKCIAGDESAIKIEKTEKVLKEKTNKLRDWKIADEGLKLKV